MPTCHICEEYFQDAQLDGFICNDCGKWTCNSCGDGDLCNLCIGDELFIANILDLEEEF